MMLTFEFLSWLFDFFYLATKNTIATIGFFDLAIANMNPFVHHANTGASSYDNEDGITTLNTI